MIVNMIRYQTCDYVTLDRETHFAEVDLHLKSLYVVNFHGCQLLISIG